MEKSNWPAFCTLLHKYLCKLNLETIHSAWKGGEVRRWPFQWIHSNISFHIKSSQPWLISMWSKTFALAQMPPVLFLPFSVSKITLPRGMQDRKEERGKKTINKGNVVRGHTALLGDSVERRLQVIVRMKVLGLGSPWALGDVCQPHPDGTGNTQHASQKEKWVTTVLEMSHEELPPCFNFSARCNHNYCHWMRIS